LVEKTQTIKFATHPAQSLTPTSHVFAWKKSGRIILSNNENKEINMLS
jgi:hypothetical protein